MVLVERRLVLSRGHGVINNEDLISHARRLKQEPGFSPDFRQFADLEDVQPSEMTNDAIHAIRGNMNPFRPDAVRAIYAPHDMTFAMSRMFEMLHADRHFLVTRSRAEAERHVGLGLGDSLALGPQGRTAGA